MRSFLDVLNNLRILFALDDQKRKSRLDASDISNAVTYRHCSLYCTYCNGACEARGF
jgi:hypothetical protein